MKKAIDIIVPIYNAYDDLVKCIASVKRHTDLSLHRLIMINDCSPDERILPYLRSEETENIVVIDNEVNGGFSNNVNKGMLYSEDRDVILLNSDTVVTENWIDKIVACAYSKPEIGSVTPMSNSATLCSYPIICQDNDIPENWSVDALAKVVERCSMKMYPRITVAVGFCMFIKREVIKRVGLFDAETFEKGYGEENDFCNRAEQLGYIHVMCDDTFIYHRGTASFVGEQKKALAEAHEKILIDRYPAQMIRNSNYCASGLDQYIRDNIHIYTKANPNKKNLLYMLQADFRDDAFDNIGGTQHHVRDLTMNMKDEYNVYVVARDRDYLRVTMYSGEEILSLKYYIGEKEGFPRIHDSEIRKLLKNILCAFEIDLVHVHHTHGISFDIFDVAEELGIPMIMSMHDYYYICPTIKLLDTEGRGCNGHCDTSHCPECLQKNGGIFTSEHYMEEWHEIVRGIFDKCELLIVPSETCKKIYLKYYPEIEGKTKVIEHGLKLERRELKIDADKIHENSSVQSWFDTLYTDEKNPYAIAGWTYLIGVNSDEVRTILEITYGNEKDYIVCGKSVRRDLSNARGNENYINAGFFCNAYRSEYLGKDIKVRLLLEHEGLYFTDGQYRTCRIQEKKSNGKYNVAFVGGMVPEKGSTKAIEMIKNSSKDICWHVFGLVGDQELASLEAKNFIKHGTYRQQDLPDLFATNHIDLVCILSTCEETFCYTLSEAVTCNIPVFVTDLGASGERVRRHAYGWTVPVEESGTAMGKRVQDILTDRKEYMLKKEIVSCFDEISLEEMSNQYKSLYEQYSKPFESKESFDATLIYNGLGISMGMRNTPYLMYNRFAGNRQIYHEVPMLLEDYFQKRKEDVLDGIVDKKIYRLYQKLRQNRLVRFLLKFVR